MKKSTLWLLLAAVLMGTLHATAQTRKKASTPNIVRFVDYYVTDPGDEEDSECMNHIYRAWQNYKKNRPQDAGCKVLVDANNGYMRYDFRYSDDADDYGWFEVCYWNCADGRHKLVAYNRVSAFDGMLGRNGQCDGILFMLYNNATGKMEDISPEDLGIDRGYGIDDPDRGYDSTTKCYWGMSPSGERITFREKEDWDAWLTWVSNNTTNSYFSLPRQGKDIVQTRVRPGYQSTTTWKWNGHSFYRAQ